MFLGTFCFMSRREATQIAVSEKEVGGETAPKVIHFEIPAENPKRAVEFYEKVFGWKIQKYGSEEMNYFLATAGDDKEQGINGAIAEKDAMHPTTVNTISVASFEETAKKIKETGGQVL